MKAIVVEDLTKRFRVAKARGSSWGAGLKDYLLPRYEMKDAVKGLSFSIQKGERVAFIGPNGAGKSTTIKMLSGIMEPSSGSSLILGRVPGKDRKFLNYHVSALFGHCSKLWYQLPVEDTFALLGSIYDLSGLEYRARVDSLAQKFDIAHLLKRVVRQLSLGERMRCELVASLIQRPEIIFLDEPTIGLDITAKAIIRDLLKQLSKEEGTTLLLTSHDTDDIELVCDRVILINKGQMVLDNTLDYLKRNVIKNKVVTVVTEEEHVACEQQGIETLESSPHKLKMRVNLAHHSIEKVIAFLLKEYKIKDLTIEDPPLETIIETLYKHGV